MSMIGNFRLAPVADVEALLREPHRVEAFLYPEELGSGEFASGGQYDGH